MPGIKSEPSKPVETDRKRIASEYFKLLAQGKFKEGLRFFAPHCKIHNPYVSGNMESLTEAMIAASKGMTGQNAGAEFKVRRILADDDFVAAHTELLNDKSNPGKGGLRQVHLLRFEGDKIVEYWDITQNITPEMPNAGGAF